MFAYIRTTICRVAKKDKPATNTRSSDSRQPTFPVAGSDLVRQVTDP